MKNSIAPFLRSSIANLMLDDNDTTYYKQIDNDLAVYVGWGGGFDEDDETCLHSRKSPEYCICVKIAEYKPYDCLWDSAYMPWDENGDVYDTDCSVSVGCDIDELAEWLIGEYFEIRVGLDNGTLTF